MIVRISRFAEAELEDIFAYGVGRWGLPHAQAYADGLTDAFARIADRQIPWRALPSALNVDGYRYRCGRHVVYWRASEFAITIVAVLHERMDQPSRLNDALAP